MRTPIHFAVLAASVLAMTGCTGTTSGTPQPTTSSGATSSSAGSGGGDTTEHGAPRVKTPLDFAKSAANPCGLITASQLQTLGMSGVVAKDDTTSLGPACGWTDTSGPSGQRVDFTFVAGEGGLDYLYQMKSSYDLFEPQPPVQGHPALLNAPTDDRKDGGCTLDIGLTDTKILTTSVQMRGGVKPAPRFAEPCVVAREAADLALANIKGGS